MPQIDFSRAFSSPDKQDSASTGSAADSIGAPDAASGQPFVESSKFRRTRLGRSEWANIIFTIIAVLGGLFCAFYFFNGAELIRSAASWPREYLYPQPGLNPTPDDERADLAAALGLPAPPDSKSANDHSGDPFSRARGLLSTNQPGGAYGMQSPGTSDASGLPGSGGGLTDGLPNPGSLLSNLGLPVPGGDSLFKTFNNDVAELQRIARVATERTVVVVKTAVRQTEKAVTKTAQNTVKTAQGTVNNVAGRTGAELGSTAQGGLAQAGTTAQAATGTVGSATSTGQQTVGAVRNGVSGTAAGLGSTRAGGLGGLGGRLGGIGGGLGGGLGGLGGHGGGLGGGGHGR